MGPHAVTVSCCAPLRCARAYGVRKGFLCALYGTAEARALTLVKQMDARSRVMLGLARCACGARKEAFSCFPGLSLRSVWDKSQTYHSLQRESSLRDSASFAFGEGRPKGLHENSSRPAARDWIWMRWTVWNPILRKKREGWE